MRKEGREVTTVVIKLDATGDVVRTTVLLRRLAGPVVWVTSAKNAVLLEGVWPGLSVVSWEDRHALASIRADLLINLEDSVECAAFAAGIAAERAFGALLGDTGEVQYTDDSRGWFDLSLISRFGRQRADELKLANRRSYQELLFEGLGFTFAGERYVLPSPKQTKLHGDVAVAPMAGPVWPIKNWAYYPQLIEVLRARGLVVNVLPKRTSLLEHVGDIQQHRCLVSGDSLPMHLALGLGVPAVSLFTCTSPWEIYPYPGLTKVVSPLLERFFYQRMNDPAGTTAISVEEVAVAVEAAVLTSTA